MACGTTHGSRGQWQTVLLMAAGQAAQPMAAGQAAGTADGNMGAGWASGTVDGSREQGTWFYL